MSDYLIKPPLDFNHGYRVITEINEPKADTGIEFGLLRLNVGEVFTIDKGLERACLLLNGKVQFKIADKVYKAKRSSLFNQEPITLHVDSNHDLQIRSLDECEIAVFKVENDKEFPIELFTAENNLSSEQRGKGILNNTAYRIVRTIFDIRNRPQAKLVLGEVINFPGCWSSYPPHCHRQPEIYHYRFTEPQGFGYGELGQQVFKTEQASTLKILDGHTHSQAAAPGYGMYYIWAIRHLLNDPYTVPDFVREHDWTQREQANQRVWSHAIEEEVL